jgi:cytochrome c nitrite reductase small subunit
LALPPGLKAFTPILLAVTLGSLLGVGLFTFGYARGASYLTDDPAACANCHVMREQYSGWLKSSHGKFAVCNDCHTPPGALAKYGTKAINGFFHSLAFTTQAFPDNIQINARNRVVTEKACLKCHEQIAHAILAAGEVSCIRCHPDAGHL